MKGAFKMLIGENIKKRGDKENTSRSKTKYVLFGLILATSLGETVSVLGVKTSWLMAIILIFFFIMDHFNKKITFLTYETKFYYYFFVFWLFYGTIQLAFVIDNSFAFPNYLSLVINIFIVTMLILNVENIKDLIFFNKALILGLIINLTIAFWEMFTGNHIITLSPNQLINHNSKVLGVFSNVNDLATFISMGIISVILNYSLSKNNGIFTIMIIIASVFVLIESGARAPLYGMLLYTISFVLFYLLLILYTRSKQVFYLLKYLIIFSGTLSVILIFSFISIEEFILMASSPGNQESDMFRLNLIKLALEGFVNSAFLGMGPGQSITLLGINVHNFFIEIMSEYGIIIISGIVIIFGYLLNAYKWGIPKMVALSILSFPPAFMLISISSSGANRIRAVWILITLMFIAISLHKKYNRADEY